MNKKPLIPDLTPRVCVLESSMQTLWPRFTALENLQNRPEAFASQNHLDRVKDSCTSLERQLRRLDEKFQDLVVFPAEERTRRLKKIRERLLIAAAILLGATGAIFYLRLLWVTVFG